MQKETFKAAVEEFQKKTDAEYHLVDRLATLATGTLAVTVTFRRELTGPPPGDLWLLKLAWLGFVLTIVGFVIVQFWKIKSHGQIAQSILQKEEPLVTSDPPWYSQVGGYVSGGGFLIGLGCIVIYGWRH